MFQESAKLLKFLIPRSNSEGWEYGWKHQAHKLLKTTVLVNICTVVKNVFAKI